MLDEIVLICRGMLFALGMATLDRMVYAIPCGRGARLKVERWLVLFVVAPCALIAGLRLGVAAVVPSYSAALAFARSPGATFGAAAAAAAVAFPVGGPTSVDDIGVGRRPSDSWNLNGDDDDCDDDDESDEYGGGADTQIDVGDVLWDFGDDADADDADYDDANGADDDERVGASRRIRSPPKITAPPTRPPPGVDSSHVSARPTVDRTADVRRRQLRRRRETPTTPLPTTPPPVDYDRDSTDPDNVKLRTYLLSALLTGAAVIAEIARNSTAPRPFPVVSALAVLAMWTAATGVWVPRVSRHSNLADAVWVLDGFVSALGLSALTYVHDSLVMSVAETAPERSMPWPRPLSASRLGANRAVVSVAPASRGRFFARLF